MTVMVVLVTGWERRPYILHNNIAKLALLDYSDPKAQHKSCTLWSEAPNALHR